MLRALVACRAQGPLIRGTQLHSRVLCSTMYALHYIVLMEQVDIPALGNAIRQGTVLGVSIAQVLSRAVCCHVRCAVTCGYSNRHTRLIRVTVTTVRHRLVLCHVTLKATCIMSHHMYESRGIGRHVTLSVKHT